MTTTRRDFLAWASASAMLPAFSPALAQAAGQYPDKSVRLVVPFPPGSVTDIVARGLGKELQNKMGATFITDNRPGAQTTIGTNHVARSEPDGYTLLVAALSFVSSPAEVKNLPYDPVKDFEPVALLGTFPIVLLVREDFPANTIEEFFAHARKLNKPLVGGYGSSSTRVAANRLGQLANLEIMEVPYKGIPLAVTDLIGGIIDFTFADLGNALTQTRGGRVKAIAVTSTQPSPHAPQWPTLGSVLPGFEITAWLTVLAPAGTDAKIVQQLHQAINDVLAQPEMQQTLTTAAMTPPDVPLPALKDFIRDEVAKWGERYKAAGIEPQ